jgi:hypothetical protein
MVDQDTKVKPTSKTQRTQPKKGRSIAHAWRNVVSHAPKYLHVAA